MNVFSASLFIAIFLLAVLMIIKDPIGVGRLVKVRNDRR